MDVHARDDDPIVVERRARRRRASSSSSAKTFAFSFVAFALSARAVGTRAEVVVSTDEVSIATKTESPPLPSLTLGDVVAKHVAFPREVRSFAVVFGSHSERERRRPRSILTKYSKNVDARETHGRQRR